MPGHLCDHGDGTDILWDRRGKDAIAGLMGGGASFQRPMRNGALSFLGQWEGAANSLGKQDGEVNPRGHWTNILSRDNSGRVILLQFK